MISIRWKILALSEPSTLCSTCTWGLTRSGCSAGEREVFCRLTTPNTLVSFAVTRCSGYVNDCTAESSAAARRIGFISSPDFEDIKLEPK
jgi:hypothetical protein